MNRKKKRTYLNKNEYDLYMIIKNFIEKNNYSPSYRELLEESEYTSIATILLTLLKLEDLGFIKMNRDDTGRVVSRTIRVIYTDEVRNKLENIKKDLEV